MATESLYQKLEARVAQLESRVFQGEEMPQTTAENETEGKLQEQRDPASIHLYINSEDPQGDEVYKAVSKAAKDLNIRFAWTNAYSGVTGAEFGIAWIEGTERVLAEIEKLY